MKIFRIKLLLILFPVLVVIGFPCYMFWSTGEYFKNPSGQHSLIGYVYNEGNYPYIKWKHLQENKVRVMALGSSRVLQFREQMFTAPFYNAGYTIVKTGDFLTFLKSLPDLPEYLIIGLDQWMFNSAWDSATPATPSYSEYTFFPNIEITKQYWAELLTAKRKLRTGAGIGMASIDGNGIRPDGSMQYGTQIVKLLNDDPTTNDYRFSNTLKRISAGIQRFQYGDEIKKSDDIDSLLSYCKLHGVKVIGFVPPFADTVYKTMVTSGKYKYIDHLQPYLKKVFTHYNYEFYYFPSAADSLMIDGFHGGELCYKNLLSTMVSVGSILIEVCDRKPYGFKNRYSVY